MILYMVQGRGLFGAASEETLPTAVHMVRAGENCEVRLDGVALPVRGGVVDIPATLTDGVHELKVNGRACEGLAVKRGKVRPVGEDFRRLLPAIARIYELEERLRALEEKAQEKQVDWLK